MHRRSLADRPMRGDRRGLGVGLAAAVAGLAVPAGAAAAETPVFEPPTNHAVLGVNPSGVAIGDLNRDGRADLATADTTSDQVTVLTQTATGGFTAAIGAAVGDDPPGLAISDVTGDGAPDIATIDGLSWQVSLLTNDGGGLFAPGVAGPTDGRPMDLAVGDIDRDGRPDIATVNWVNSTVSVFLAGTTPGTFSVSTVGSAPDFPQSIALGDLDGDGRLDIVTSGTTDDTVEALRQRADGTFERSTLATIDGAPTDVEVADMDGDGRADLVVTDQANARILLLAADGAGAGYAERVLGTVAGPARRAKVGDVNHDGRPDVVVAETGSGAVTVFAQDADRTSYAPTAIGNASGMAVDLTLGDVDGDGRIDVATANPMTNDVSVFLNRTPVAVAPPVDGPPGEGPSVEGPPSEGPAPLLAPTPATPTAGPAPAADEDPLDRACLTGGLELVGVTSSGHRALRRVRLAGVADPSLAGRSVRVLRNGRRVGTTTVRAGGAVATVVPAPKRVRDAIRARYQLVLDSRRSRAIRAARRANVTSRSVVAAGRVQVRGAVGRVAGRRTLTVRATPFCGSAAPRTWRIRSDRRGRFVATLAAPPAGERPLVYRIFDGRRTVTLPLVVTARR